MTTIRYDATKTRLTRAEAINDARQEVPQP